MDGDLFKVVLTLPLLDQSQQHRTVSAQPEEPSAGESQQPEKMELTVQPLPGQYGVNWEKVPASDQTDGSWHTPAPREPSPNRFAPAAEKKQDRRKRRGETARKVERRVERRMNHVFKSMFEPLDDHPNSQN